ncbi:MAG: hypothetical protein GY771_08915 [bacterium]|nr:hypothetical protein [bacterium]
MIMFCWLFGHKWVSNPNRARGAIGYRGVCARCRMERV